MKIEKTVKVKNRKDQSWKAFQAKSIHGIENIYYNVRQIAYLKNQDQENDIDYIEELEQVIAADLEELASEIFEASLDQSMTCYLIWSRIQERDNLYEHVFRVSLLVAIMATQENYQEKEIKNAIMGTLTHEFGQVILKPRLNLDYWVDYKVAKNGLKHYRLGFEYLQKNPHIYPEVKCVMANQCPYLKQKIRQDRVCSSYEGCRLGQILWVCDDLDHYFIELKA